RRAGACELVDDRDRRDQVAPGPAVRLVNREAADAERRELVEHGAVERVRLVPRAHLLARHLGGGEAAQRVAQLRDVLRLVGEVHARSRALSTTFHPRKPLTEGLPPRRPCRGNDVSAMHRPVPRDATASSAPTVRRTGRKAVAIRERTVTGAATTLPALDTTSL